MKRILSALLLLCMLLTGCHASTTITRQEQLDHVTRQETTAPVTDTTAVTTTVATQPATTLPPDTTAEPETAPSVTETKPEYIPDTPPDSKPTATTAPPSVETTLPETSAVTQPPETVPPETTLPETVPTTPSQDPYDISGYAPGSLEHAIHAAINGCRADAGLAPLELDTRLSAISSVRAYEASVSFKHTRPDGTDCFTVLDDYGYSGFSTAGENLLQCSDGYTAEDMVDLWMGSSGHRANILSADFTAMGIGVYRSNGMTFVATLFVG